MSGFIDALLGRTGVEGTDVPDDELEDRIDVMVQAARSRGDVVTREQARELILGEARRRRDARLEREAAAAWAVAVRDAVPPGSVRKGCATGGASVTAIVAGDVVPLPPGVGQHAAHVALDEIVRSGGLVLRGSGDDAFLARRWA